SDDPNNASVSVPLSATVLETPALVVEPASIEAALAAGEAGTVSLELSNPGSGLLEFEFPDFAASDGAGSGALAGAAADHSGRVRFETGNTAQAGIAARAASSPDPEPAPLSNRSASLEIAIESFEAFGGEFVPVATDLSGALNRIDADFVLEQATGLTWANDLALIITEGPELTADSILLQVGGTFTLAHGGVRLGWGMGSSSEPGTPVQTSIALDQALLLEGAQAWIGNAWVPEDSGQWSGTIGLDGVIDGTRFITAVNPAAGQIAGGESLAVELTLSALDLVAGTYRDRLRLSSNAPVAPDLDIIAELTVSGEPELSLSPSALDFGTVFTGATESASIVLSNPGTDVLLIDRVEASGEGFSVDGDGFPILPGASAVLAIEFFSDSAGDFTGQLEVTNNASDATAIVELTATVQDPGILTISDTAVTVEVPSGATAQTTLTLGNIGASPLAFEASTSQAGAPDGAGLPSAARPALSMAPSRPVAKPMPLGDGPPIRLNEDRDILWEQVPNGSFGIISTRSTELDAGFYAADSFEIDGAALVQGLTVHGFRFDEAGRFDEVFESVVFYVYEDADGQPAGSPDAAEAGERFRFEAGVGTPGFNVDEDSTAAGHRADVSLDLEAATGEGLLLPEGRYWLVVHAVSASPDLISDTWAAVTSLEGSQSARIIDSDNIFDLGATTWQPLADLIAPETSNLAFRIEGQALSFLSLAPTQGVIDVDQTQELQLLFDATDFPPGAYETMLMIRTDSPATPEVAIPVTMVVGEGEPGLNWVNLAGPSEAEIIAGQSVTIHGSARLAAERGHDLTDVEMWVGFHDHDSHPGLWPESAWVAGSMLAADGEHADFAVESGAHLAPGQYRYATRFRLADGRYVYGGYHETGGGFWDGLLHVSGRLEVLSADADQLFRDRFRATE
ncbi:MAG: choice-of-anchor D domain-containing protein, partial [Wenzhouxiangella sp.]|nr:choice-of-anchor D domain-containing protein [Wenzhouxiangella sp.]